ncbi:MAG: queuosine salvage family protein [Archaeoglobaceae archaeon]
MENRDARIEEIAEIIKRLNYKPVPFTNPELFPPLDDFIYPNYVFFMVAIDHKTGFDVKWKYQGSDLLFYLARRKQIEEGDFFTAKKLVNIKTSEISQIFTFEGKKVRNVEERAFLLRDCARKLIENYQGDIMNLIKVSDFRISEIAEKLKIFAAYEDPLMKKTFLFLKILKRAGFEFKDPHNLKFPIDSVLVRVALCLDILEIDKELMKKIMLGIPISPSEALRLRKKTGEVLELLSKKSGIEPDVLDDILWNYGRAIDREIETPIDERVNVNVLKDFLELLRRRRLPEINFPPSWYF